VVIDAKHSKFGTQNQRNASLNLKICYLLVYSPITSLLLPLQPMEHCNSLSNKMKENMRMNSCCNGPNLKVLRFLAFWELILIELKFTIIAA